MHSDFFIIRNFVKEKTMCKQILLTQISMASVFMNKKPALRAPVH